MANSSYGSREGLTARSAASSSSSEISLQIDPINADLDDHILGLRGRVSRLKGVTVHRITSEGCSRPIKCRTEFGQGNVVHAVIPVANEIKSEAKLQSDFISQLQMTLTKAQAGVKNNMGKINKKIIQNGSNHLVHVVLFALGCFFLVYVVSKFSRT
ncbi:bet1-like protein At1g29060 isoform X1 [Brachypodium distachyon]|uniref:bet1-like protein At1g29060 isoform X1 n=1 Tax=Brachypodium distachyon TaxID=15368 RepID=UPI000D0D455C|nr:bet1-like protein At1g29060 isoform X1 [Brachypodium distachyon]|eukprot:XP_024314429.1 bet1-like protein At1g29060 isoform X1 [Brachypodium distachyon]